MPKAAINAKDAQADFILISHGHGDHVGDSVDIAKRTGATVVSNYEISLWLEQQGVKKVHGQQHGGADAVEQRRGGIAIKGLLQREIHQRGKLARIELVEARVARLAGARPLGVQLGLRPKIESLGRDEALLGARKVAVRDLALRLREMRRAAGGGPDLLYSRTAAPPTPGGRCSGCSRRCR